MTKSCRLLLVLVLFTAVSVAASPVLAESGETSRIVDPKQHVRVGTHSYPFRERVEYVMKELDLRPGDTVLDLGCGDGWWTEPIAKAVGPEGVVHAAEVSTKLVDGLKKRFVNTPQVKPYQSPTDATGLPDDSCDLVFLSQTYHHLPKDKRVEYLNHLRKVIKPTGRLVVIEKNLVIATQANGHGTNLSELTKVAEATGWIPLRIELMTGTYHYMAIFAQREMFPPEPERKKRK